jgi:hypothetical protein
VPGDFQHDGFDPGQQRLCAQDADAGDGSEAGSLRYPDTPAAGRGAAHFKITAIIS